MRRAVGNAMKLMGRQFVLGETIRAAMDRARTLEGKGYTYSYDMLGEAARTDADAQRYAAAYAAAIAAIGGRASGDVGTSPGISVKLSALHPRYEWSHRAEVMDVLVPRARDLARAAARAGIGFNIDAEEAERLDLSLDVIEALMADRLLAGWDGFGVVVQAYGRRAGAVIDFLRDLAVRHDRRIMVRLVKGAYWDSEVKQAQEKGLPGFPVFTRKPATDVSYLANARQLLDARDRIYPQFATHNAHTVAAVLEMAGDRHRASSSSGCTAWARRCTTSSTSARARAAGSTRRSGRIATCSPIWCGGCSRTGRTRRSSTRSSTRTCPPAAIAADPIAAVEGLGAAIANPAIRRARGAVRAARRTRSGWNVNEPASVAALVAARAPWREHRWLATPRTGGGEPRPVVNPADPGDSSAPSPRRRRRRSRRRWRRRRRALPPGRRWRRRSGRGCCAPRPTSTRRTRPS